MSGLEEFPNFQMIPYKSFPENHSCVQSARSYDVPINNKIPKHSSSTTASSWKKSDSWSWKTNDVLDIHSNVPNKNKQNEVNQNYY